MTERAEHAILHDAISEVLDDGEIAIAWTLTIDIAGSDGSRHLAHRAGGGHDGSDSPMAWTALGMLQSSVDVARDQLRDMTVDHDDDEPPGDA